MSTPSKDYDITYKVLVIGESSVGKTCLIQRYSRPDEKLAMAYVTTIGIDFVNSVKIVDNVRIRLQIWDTAGQERFRTFTKLHFRGTKGLILMYDLTNLETFEKLTNWLKDIKTYELDKEQLIVVGNKSDLEQERQVSKERGEKLAYEFGFKFFETSAKDGTNIQEVFDELTTDMKDANNPYFVPTIPDPRFELDMAKIEIVPDEPDRGLRVVDEGNKAVKPSGNSYYSSCCGS
ncbi:ras-related protein Rab-13-like [Dendronephthya gigantea]|uniref:ras-related protein Rab-13-like n=1 Tax=Dendronephthya gigantea TaxID=151771 RepID=UPI00106BC855|nr:ras-related protein Rab-13-like [Dendronephthya gigantea]XP_028402352.1 ras-related protein Rab-13-like [Dendronephthya gigantea]XP_028402353.1 ras-related protein Rab-13-like [Dendronephthya gigantea]